MLDTIKDLTDKALNAVLDNYKHLEMPEMVNDIIIEGDKHKLRKLGQELNASPMMLPEQAEVGRRLMWLANAIHDGQEGVLSYRCVLRYTLHSELRYLPIEWVEKIPSMLETTKQDGYLPDKLVDLALDTVKTHLELIKYVK